MMDGNKKVKITNKKQFECLVNLMEKNPNIALGLKFAEGKQNYGTVWKNFSTKLNSLGPPVRNVGEWQKVWADFKLKIRKKLLFNKREQSATGDVPNKICNFSKIEETVINLLYLNKMVSHSGRVFGVEEESNKTNTKESDIEDSTQNRTITDDTDDPASNFGTHFLASTEIGNNLTDKFTSRERNTSLPKINSKDYRRLLEVQNEYLKQIVKNTADAVKYSRNDMKCNFESELIKKHFNGEERLLSKDQINDSIGENISVSGDKIITENCTNLKVQENESSLPDDTNKFYHDERGDSDDPLNPTIDSPIKIDISALLAQPSTSTGLQGIPDDYKFPSKSGKHHQKFQAKDSKRSYRTSNKWNKIVGATAAVMNEIGLKEKYYRKKIKIAERKAIAMERSAIARERIADALERIADSPGNN